ncbi:hypothetical protein UA08_09484 [Talaromyces atroroseus]|uniref:Uncharacterized protein n=1 Tax=Talaromyces atroroseus TaxID=1441469 RepID=A0A1Q5Q6I5_TALAT|nr:hypothetical protein UA08_09484 [Talaromyces atroroseus]OKL55261.1 hypothetical protein UA08_09484 [Talaromyces atroroseus]
MSDEQPHQYVNPEWLQLPRRTSRDEWPDTPHMVNEPPSFRIQAATMESTGFTIVECSEEPSEKAVEKVLEAFNLALSRGLTGSEGPTVHCIGGQESEEYLRTGTEDKWIEKLAEREFRREYRWIQEQSPVILRGKDGVMEGDIKTAHPSKKAISIIRVVRGEIDPSRGQMKLFGMSHHGPWQVAHRLTNRHLLVMKGILEWKLQPDEETVLIWKGFSEHPMLQDVLSPSAYPFMIFAVPLSLEGAFPEPWMADVGTDA